MIPELRPRGIGEMLDAAVSVYRARFRPLMLVTLCVVVPVQILTTLVLLSAQPDGFSVSITGATTPTYDSGSAAVRLGAIVVVFVVNLLSTTFVLAVCTRIVADAYTDQIPSLGSAVLTARRRVFAVIGLSLLVAISEGIGFFFCFVGALVPLTFFAVAVPALILESIGVTAALGRSATLVKAHFGRTLGLVLSVQALTSIVNIGLAAAIGLLVRGGDNTTAAIFGQGLASAVSAALTTPFVATAIVVLYFDLRIREEAYDVQLLMQRNDARYAA